MSRTGLIQKNTICGEKRTKPGSSHERNRRNRSQHDEHTNLNHVRKYSDANVDKDEVEKAKNEARASTRPFTE